MFALRYAVSAGSRETPLADTQVCVSPTSVSEPVDTTFTITVGISDVVNLGGFDVKLGWDPAVLGYVSHTTTPEAVLNLPIYIVANTSDAVAGTYWLCAATFGGEPFSGSGTIFTLTLRVKAEGFSDLEFLTHDLSDPVAELIPNTAVNGTFDNRPVLPVSIISPENKTYSTDNVPLTFTLSKPAVWMGYRLDGAAYVTITGNTTLAGLSEGTHYVQVYANCTDGRTELSTKVHFTVDTTPPTFEAVGWVGVSPSPYLPASWIRSNEPVLVTARIIDPDIVNQVTICYSADSGTWWNGTMTYNSTGDVWTCTLPGQIGSQTVEFFITAYDTAQRMESTQRYSYNTYSTLIGDLDGDGGVDIFDIVMMAANYGETLP